MIVTRSRQKLMNILNDNGYNERPIEIKQDVFFDLCFMKNRKQLVRHQSTHTRIIEADEIIDEMNDDIVDELPTATENITGNIPTVVQHPQQQQVLKVIKDVPFGAKGRKRRASMFANKSVFDEENKENQIDNQYNVCRETQKKSKSSGSSLIDLIKPASASTMVGNGILSPSLQSVFNDLAGIDFSRIAIRPIPIHPIPIRPIPVHLNPIGSIPIMMPTTNMEKRKESLKKGFVAQMILDRVNNINMNEPDVPSTSYGTKDSTTGENSGFGQLRYDSDDSD